MSVFVLSRRRRLPAIVVMRAFTSATVPLQPAYAATAHSKRITASTAMPTRSSPHWRIRYADDFTNRLNTSAWSVYTQPGSSNPTTAWYSSKHVRVNQGQLKILGYVDRKAKADGRVVTGGLGLWRLPQRYGKYEILVRMDRCQDVKYAWMLWPYNNQWPGGGEVDFAEDEGGNRAVTTATTLFAARGGQPAHFPQDHARPVGGFSSWHVLGVVWTPKSIRYTLDGHYWGKAKTSHLPKGPMVLVLQTEGKVRPKQVDLKGGSCNAHVGWVVQYSYR
jgi:beta-glucanase (GH16 family)